MINYIKYVCINSTYYCPFIDMSLKKINIGDMFDVVKLPDGYNWCQSGEVLFSTYDISDSFITLVEWREKQINYILDETISED